MTSPDAEWDRRARALEFDQLGDLRKAAEQWRNGIAALTGIVIAATAVKGVGSFSELSTLGKSVALGALGVALSALTVGALAAMRAAFPHADEVLNSGEDLRRWTEQEVITSRKFLRASKILAPIAVASLALGAGVSWISTKTRGPVVSVTLDTGSTFCGRLDRGVSGLLTLRSASGDGPTTTTIHLADITSITPGSC